MTTITVDFLQKITLIDPANRKEVIADLKKKLLGPLTLSDHKKLWKALYYAMWSSDKYYNQQILSQDISQLSRVYYSNSAMYFQFAKAMFYVFIHEWEKIDYWRVNKFMMLFRECMEEVLKLCKHFDWKVLPQINSLYNETMFNVTEHQSIEGLSLHFVQIYLSCMIKHMNDKTTYEHIKNALEPFLNILQHSNNKSLREKVYHYVFEALIEKKQADNTILAQFVLEKYGTLVFQLAQQLNLTPPNRKMLYDLAELYHFSPMADEEEQKEIREKPKKKKKKKQPKVVEQVIEEVEEVVCEPVVEEPHKNGKQQQIAEKQTNKLKKSIISNVPEIVEDVQDIEGLDYSEIKNSPARLRILKDIMSSIPPYLFMSPAEKRKYFKQINVRFQDIIQKESGRKCSHERQVKFNLQRNQVKEFRFQDNVLKISQ